MKNSNAVSRKVFRKFKNDTGALVFFALEAYEVPATADQIVSLISDGKKYAKDTIRDHIKETLEKGVALGFLGKEKRRYFLPMTKQGRESKVSSKSKIPMKACKKTKGSILHCSNCCLSQKNKCDDEEKED